MCDTEGFVPPLDDWSQQAAEVALRSLVRDRTKIGPDEARRRLQRLTADQREWVESRLDLWDTAADEGAECLPESSSGGVLIVVGDRIDPLTNAFGVELWCVPFEGWGAVHRLEASHWVVPRRFVVLTDTVIQASGMTVTFLVLPGEVFDLQVHRPLQPPTGEPHC